MHLTRRFFLQATGSLVAYLGVAPVDLFARAGVPRPASLPRVTRGKTLVVIFLRGGADGLNLVIPHGDPAYADLRKGIGLGAPGAGKPESVIDLDGFFGLHPRLKAMGPLFESGVAAAAHAVGYDKNTRSHFEEQDVWETGVVGNTYQSDGWLNRHLATSEGHGPFRAVTIGDALPRILHGKATAYAIRGLDDLSMPGGKADPHVIAAALEHAYCVPTPDRPKAAADARDLLAQSARTTLDGLTQLKAIADQPYTPKAEYPKTPLATKLQQVARLVKADIGLEVAELDIGGWDTHQNQGAAAGQFGDLAQQLGDALAAFAADLDDRLDDVTVVTISDFGRTAAENGTGGTDHGWANCMLLVGGPVARAGRQAAEAGKPRKVVTTWPGLAHDQLHQGRDLLHTTDFRDVLSELVKVHLGNPHLETILPQHEFKPVGLIA
jgi:uncharacterized protein (DUF1501 family)